MPLETFEDKTYLMKVIQNRVHKVCITAVRAVRLILFNELNVVKIKLSYHLR